MNWYEANALLQGGYYKQQKFNGLLEMTMKSV